MKWVKLLSRGGVDLPIIAAVDTVFYEILEEQGKNQKLEHFSLFKDRVMTHFTRLDVNEVGRVVYKKYFDKPSQVEQYYKDGCKLLDEIKSSTKRIEKELREKGDFFKAYKELKRQFEIVCHIYSIISWTALEAWQYDFEKIISDLLKDYKGDKGKVINALSKPWKKSAVYEIQDKIKKGVPTSEIVKEYQFLRDWAIVWYKPIDESWVKSLDAGDVEDDSVDIDKLLEELKPDKKARHFIEMAPYLMFFRDWRDDIRRAHAYYWTFFFEMLAEKYDVEYDDFGYLTIEEVGEIIEQDKIDKKLIERRKNNPVIIHGNSKEIFVLQDDIDSFMKIIEGVEEREKEGSVKGLIVEHGKVEGVVRVIETYKDLEKVEPGEILVANTTHANYLPAMHKAAGFVTNEGGIASHAAIVARELKKPSIVGTKNATKVLNTGDKVIVDADEGVVRKVE